MSLLMMVWRGSGSFTVCLQVAVITRYSGVETECLPPSGEHCFSRWFPLQLGQQGHGRCRWEGGAHGVCRGLSWQNSGGMWWPVKEEANIDGLPKKYPWWSPKVAEGKMREAEAGVSEPKGMFKSKYTFIWWLTSKQPTSTWEFAGHKISSMPMFSSARLNISHVWVSVTGWGGYLGWGRDQKDLWEQGSWFSAWDWCGGKFVSLDKGLPPWVRDISCFNYQTCVNYSLYMLYASCALTIFLQLQCTGMQKVCRSCEVDLNSNSQQCTPTRTTVHWHAESM
jgi:hypothetical protein